MAASFATFSDALSAWQTATRQIRTLQGRIDNAEAACATQRANQVAAQAQLDSLRQQQSDAHDAMQSMV